MMADKRGSRRVPLGGKNKPWPFLDFARALMLMNNCHASFKEIHL